MVRAMAKHRLCRRTESHDVNYIVLYKVVIEYISLALTMMRILRVNLDFRQHLRQESR